MIDSNEKLPCKKVVWKITYENYVNISPMKRQFVVTHAIIQTEIPTLIDSWVTDTHAVKILCPQKKKLLALMFS
jgi:hypothetical protein